MRDANVTNLPYVDGYLLRVEWSQLEPTNGVFDFTIINNIFSKLPANQKLSILLMSDSLPTWLNTLPGIATWTAGTPSVTSPLPWNAISQEQFRLLLVALGNNIVNGVPLSTSPRLASINVGIPGLANGIREPSQINLSNMLGYTRTGMQNAVLTYLANATNNFPNVPVQIGFWTYVDNQDANFGGITAWEQLRESILTQQNGVAHPQVGFYMDNLAANRPAADSDPSTGLPVTSFAAPLSLSQNNAYTAFQTLGSWSNPFNATHVGKLLNGTPGDGLDYGFNTYQLRYCEFYQSDVTFANYAAEFQRWHDFLNALPLPLLFTSSQGGATMNTLNGLPVNLTLSTAGGTAPYVWTFIGGTLPAGVTLTLSWSSAMGDSYQVEVSSDLVTWTALGIPVKAAAPTMTWIDDGTLTGTLPSRVMNRFYRVQDCGVL